MTPQGKEHGKQQKARKGNPAVGMGWQRGPRQDPVWGQPPPLRRRDLPSTLPPQDGVTGQIWSKSKKTSGGRVVHMCLLTRAGCGGRDTGPSTRTPGLSHDSGSRSYRNSKVTLPLVLSLLIREVSGLGQKQRTNTATWNSARRTVGGLQVQVPGAPSEVLSRTVAGVRGQGCSLGVEGGRFLQGGLLLPSNQRFLRQRGPAAPAGASIQMCVLLGLWQAGVGRDELSQALRRGEAVSARCWRGRKGQLLCVCLGSAQSQACRGKGVFQEKRRGENTGTRRALPGSQCRPATNHLHNLRQLTELLCSRNCLSFLICKMR